MSVYGYRRQTTPNAEELARSGTAFENAIATAPWRLTSQATLMTGLFPSEHGAVFNSPSLNPALETLAEKMKAEGYATLGVTTDAIISSQSGFDQGFDTFIEIRPEEDGLTDSGSSRAETELLRWIEGRSGATGQPFFAYVLLTNPQLPFNPPGEYVEAFLERPLRAARLEQLTQYWIPFARQFTIGAAELTPEDLGALVALYDGEVSYADHRIGRVVESLREIGILDDTLVVLTSDVGEDLGDHGLLADASSLYDTMVHVPLVMRLPGIVAAGERVAAQVQTVDLVKAIGQMVKPATPLTEGISPMPLRPVAVSEARVDLEALGYYRRVKPDEDLSVLERNLLAVRTNEFKYILTSRGTAALFDLGADPGETESVLNQNTEVAQELMGKLNQWASALSRPAGLPAANLPVPAGEATPREEPAR